MYLIANCDDLDDRVHYFINDEPMTFSETSRGTLAAMAELCGTPGERDRHQLDIKLQRDTLVVINFQWLRVTAL